MATVSESTNSKPEHKAQRLDKSEIDSIHEFANTYSDINNKMGEFAMNMIILNEEIENTKTNQDQLAAKYKQARSSELKFANELKQKYGDGEINIQDGTFKPN